MIAVCGLMQTDLRVLETSCFLLDCEDLDILQQRSLITLERDDVVRFPVHDLLGDAALTSHRVERDNGALDRHHLEQRGNGDDFVRLFIHLDLPEHESLARREG